MIDRYLHCEGSQLTSMNKINGKNVVTASPVGLFAASQSKHANEKGIILYSSSFSLYRHWYVLSTIVKTLKHHIAALLDMKF